MMGETEMSRATDPLRADDYLTDPDMPGLAIETAGHGGAVYATARYVEYLDYLREYHPKLHDELTEGDADERWLTDRAEVAARRVVGRYVTPNALEVTTGTGGDDPHLSIEYSVGVNLTTDEAWGKAWGFYAAMANLTDPGTFGWPFLFTEIERELEGLSDE